MAEYTHKVLNMVNVKSYAASSDFLGYFESKIFGEFKIEAIDFFIEYFYEMLTECFLICSVTQGYARESARNDHINKALNDLILKGWIESDKDNVNEEFNAFNIEKNDIPMIRSLCELVIEDFTFGHVFFYWDSKELIVYPHDDFGFGVLAPPKSEGETLGYNFLKAIATNMHFNVDIRRTFKLR